MRVFIDCGKGILAKEVQPEILPEESICYRLTPCAKEALIMAKETAMIFQKAWLSRTKNKNGDYCVYRP